MERVFQAFRPLAAGAVDAAAAEAVLREDFPGAYRLPPGGRLAFHPGEELPAQEQALLDELVQHLAGLAYLPDGFYQDYFERPRLSVSSEQWRAINAALREFIREDGWARRAGLPEWAFGDGGQPPQAIEWLPLLLQRLNSLTSLDGELLLARPLRLGEKSVYSRVLQYRLRILGQYFDNEEAPARLDERALLRAFIMPVKLGLKRREEVDFESSELAPELFQLLGDAHRMFGHYLESHQDDVLFYHLPEPEEAVAHSRWLICWRGRFVYADSEKIFRRRIQQQTLLDYEQVNAYLQGRGQADMVFASSQNELGLRLLQLKLWMAGFYYGRLDGWWGPLSQQALLALLEQEGIEKEKHLNRFILSVEDNYQAVNLARLGGLLAAYNPPESAAPQQEQQLLDAIPAGEEETVQAALYGHDDGLGEFYRESRKNGRRLYFGLRSLAASALRGIKNILDWIKRKVKQVAGAVISFFKAVSKRIREGILIFAESFRRFLHFVLRKPIVTPEPTLVPAHSAFAITRFAVDSDAINLYSDSLSPALMEEHLALIRRLTEGLSLFLAIATEVIHLIAILSTLATPVGWLKLGLWIARKVEEVVGRGA